MIDTDAFTLANVSRLWATIIFLAIVVTVVAIIAMHILTAVVEAIRTGTDDPQIDDLEDERDKLIDLKGTKVSYFVTSTGAFLAMLAFALGQSPLVMFVLLIFFGVLAQIVGDTSRLVLYRRGV